jgi:hypothetical protein
MEHVDSQRHVAPAPAADVPTQNDATPVCLSCGQYTRLVRTISNLGVFPQILIFQCPCCHCVKAIRPLGRNQELGAVK